MIDRLDPSRRLHIAVYFDEPKNKKPIEKTTVVRNKTTGRNAGVVSTTVVEVHNVSVDDLPPPGVEGKLSEVKPLPKLPEGRQRWQTEDD